jgi:hypothetical protein
VSEAFEQAGPLREGVADSGTELSFQEGHVDDPGVQFCLERFGERQGLFGAQPLAPPVQVPGLQSMNAGILSSAEPAALPRGQMTSLFNFARVPAPTLASLCLGWF